MTTAIKDRVSSPGVGPVLAAAVLGFLLGIALASAVHVVGQGGGGERLHQTDHRPR